MKEIEIIIVDRGKVTKSFTINYTEDRCRKLKNLEDIVEICTDSETLRLLYRYNRNYNMILWRTYLRGWLQEDWANRLQK